MKNIIIIITKDSKRYHRYVEKYTKKKGILLMKFINIRLPKGKRLHSAHCESATMLPARAADHADVIISRRRAREMRSDRDWETEREKIFNQYIENFIGESI